MAHHNPVVFLDEDDSDNEDIFMPSVLPPAPETEKLPSDSALAVASSSPTVETEAHLGSEATSQPLSFDINEPAPVYEDGGGISATLARAPSKRRPNGPNRSLSPSHGSSTNGRDAVAPLPMSTTKSTKIRRSSTNSRTLLLQSGHLKHGHQKTSSISQNHAQPNSSNPHAVSSSPPSHGLPSSANSTSALPSLASTQYSVTAPLSSHQNPLQQNAARLRPLANRQLDLATKTELTSFPTIASVLRFRGASPNAARQPAFSLLDHRGRPQADMSFEKLSLRAEKIAQILTKRHQLQQNAAVALIYRRSDFLEFVPALFGTFFAEGCAVPIVPAGDGNDLSDLKYILESSRAKTILTTESNHKSIMREMQIKGITLGEGITWIRTNDLGMYQPKRRGTLEIIKVDPSEIAYVEYSRNVLGELKGVELRHRGVLSQCASLASSFELTSDSIIAAGLECRQRLGIWWGVFLGVWSGCHTLICPDSLDAMHGVASLFGKTEVSHAVFDLPTAIALRDVAKSEASNQTGHSRRHSSHAYQDLSRLKHLLIDFAPPNVRVPHFLVDELSLILEPFGVSANVVQPILSLAEFGGIVIAAREGQSSSEMVLDPDHLSQNKAQLVKAKGPDRKGAKGITIVDHGVPSPLAHVVIVDGAGKTLPPLIIGEIWVTSTYIPPSFREATSPSPSDACFDVYLVDDATSSEETMPRYLRTGYIGYLHDGRLFVTGILSERITITHENGAVLYHYTTDISDTLQERIHGVKCSLPFSIILNEEELVVIVAESAAKADAVQNLGNLICHVTKDVHLINVYAVVVCASQTLPRSRDGTLDVETIRKYFDYAFEAPPSGHIAKDQALQGPLASPNLVDDLSGQNLLAFGSLSEILAWRGQHCADEQAWMTFDAKGRETKTVTFGKMSIKVASVANFLTGKKGLKRGDHAILVFAYSLDFIYALHACLHIGIVAVVLPPFDETTHRYDMDLVLDALQKLEINALLVSTAFADYLSSKAVVSLLRQKEKQAGIKSLLPPVIDTSKAPKANNKMDNDTMINMDKTAIISVYTNEENSEVYYQRISGRCVLRQCTIQKETCAISSTRNIMTSVCDYNGLGLIYAALLGVFCGCCTLVVSANEFAQHVTLWCEMLDKYRVKDVYITGKMLKQELKRLRVSDHRAFSLHNVQNVLVSMEGQVDIDLLDQITATFAGNRLEDTAVKPIYGSFVNPSISIRLDNRQACEVYIDSRSLRVNRVVEVEPNSIASIKVQDYGRPTSQTEVIIVDTETHQICAPMQVGEIWVNSTANYDGLAGVEPALQRKYFGRISNDFPGETFARSGDVGFLYPRKQEYRTSMSTATSASAVANGPGAGRLPLLCVLGSRADTLEHGGMRYYASAIEATAEKAHASIVTGGCLLMLNEENQWVLLLELEAASDALDCCCVVVNALLDEHEVMLNRLLFFERGELARTRFGDKKRQEIAQHVLSGELKPRFVFETQ